MNCVPIAIGIQINLKLHKGSILSMDFIANFPLVVPLIIRTCKNFFLLVFAPKF